MSQAKGTKRLAPVSASAHTRAATQQRSIKILNAYLAAGIKLLNKYRLQELRIPDLAKHCGCSVGSFYLRFHDKEAYFKALQTAVMREAENVVSERLSLANLQRMSAEESLDSMVDLMADIFTTPGRGVLRESLLRIQEAGDPWGPMRQAGRDVIRRYREGAADKFPHFPVEDAQKRLSFCFQAVVGVLQNELVNDYHVYSTRDDSVRGALKELLRSFMRVAA